MISLACCPFLARRLAVDCAYHRIYDSVFGCVSISIRVRNRGKITIHLYIPIAEGLIVRGQSLYRSLCRRYTVAASEWHSESLQLAFEAWEIAAIYPDELVLMYVLMLLDCFKHVPRPCWRSKRFKILHHLAVICLSCGR